jgi:hypothetical protein
MSMGAALSGFVGTSVSAADQLAVGSMMGIHPETGVEMLPEHAFQFLPENIQDSIQIGWESKPVPAMSHALMQWGGNEGRDITFEVVMFRHMRPVNYQPSSFGAPKESPSNEVNQPFNVNIEYMVSWFRAFCYPSYGQKIGNYRRPISPPLCLLNLPGLALNEDGGDVILTVMTSCDVTYEKAFPNGQPRSVRLSLAFKQIVQDPRNGLTFKSQDDLRGARKKFRDESLYGKPTKRLGDTAALNLDVNNALSALDSVKL